MKEPPFFTRCSSVMASSPLPCGAGRESSSAISARMVASSSIAVCLRGDQRSSTHSHALPTTLYSPNLQAGRGCQQAL